MNNILDIFSFVQTDKILIFDIDEKLPTEVYQYFSKENIQYFRLLKKFKYGHLFLFLSFDELICFPFFIRQFDQYLDFCTPYGLDGVKNKKKFNPEFIKQWAQKQGFIAGYLQFSGFDDCEINRNSDYLEDGNTIFIIKLGMGYEKISSQYSKNILLKLEESRKFNFKLVSNPATLKEAFTDLYQETIKRVGASHTYQFSKDFLDSIISLESSISLGIEVDNKIIAISLFQYDETTVNYFINASTDEGRIYSTLLIDHAIKEACNLSANQFCLGGGVKDNDGLFQFKKRFGGMQKKIKSCKLICNDKKYQSLSEGKTGKFFPAYYN